MVGQDVVKRLDVEGVEEEINDVTRKLLEGLVDGGEDGEGTSTLEGRYEATSDDSIDKEAKLRG